MADSPETSPQLKPLTPRQQVFVSEYLSDAGRNGTRAAAKAGYKHPAEQAVRLLRNDQIQSHIAQWRAEVKELAITNMDTRLEVLDAQKAKLLALQEARAEAYKTEDHPGAHLGILVRQEKVIGSGPEAMHVVEWTYDAAITKDILALDAQAAKELGQWTERHDHSGSLSREIVVVFEDGS